MAELPSAARRYVAAIEERAGVPISHVSVGPERNQTIVTAASLSAGTATAVS
jgi:adenylosuccinate synthase